MTGTDLIQAGTQATVTGDGSVTYSAWTEILPDFSRTTPLQVTAGDTVTVTITEQTNGRVAHRDGEQHHERLL